MPTYEYACPTCDATHEVQQKMSDATLTACPVCGDPGVRKLFSGVGIHFKGSGFYRTDSRDSKSTATAGAAKGGSSADAGGSSSSNGASTGTSGSSTSAAGTSGGSGTSGSTSSGSSAANKAATPA